MDNNYTTKWVKGIAYEVAFWNNVFRWRHTLKGMMGWSHYGDVISLEGFDANAYLNSCQEPVVLDVGCGMSYATGNFIENEKGRQPINLHYVDPLAYDFNDILKKRKSSLPRIEFGMAEYLSAFYPNNEVDLIIIQNALDHSFDPMKGIMEAIDTLSPNGILYLNHHPDEAVMEHYKGFHQWNINCEGDNLVIWNKETKLIVNELVNTFAQVTVRRHDNGHVIAIIAKTGNRPAHTADDKRDIRRLCEQTMMASRYCNKSCAVIKSRLSYWGYNIIQFFAQAMPWSLKMKVKKLIKQA